MRIFYELPYTVIIEIVWTFYLKSLPTKFQKYLKHISWVISGTSSPKLSCNARHPSRNISCNHRHHLLQPSWRRIFLHRITKKLGSTATSTVIRRLLPLTNYISGAENETQRALCGPTNGNIEMTSPSAAAMLTMVAAATIVRFPPVYMPLQKRFLFHFYIFQTILNTLFEEKMFDDETFSWSDIYAIYVTPAACMSPQQWGRGKMADIPQMTFSNDEYINTLAPISLKRILVCAVNNRSSVVSLMASHRIGRSASHYRKQCW